MSQPTQVPLVRAASLTNYHAVARDSGLNPTRLLLEAGLPPHVLDQPDAMIPTDRVGRLLQNASVASGNESFALCMASTRRLSNLGPVGLLIRDQETLRDSLEMLVRHLAVLNGALTLSIEEHGDTVVLRKRLLSAAAREPMRQRVELVMGVMTRAICQLIGRHWQPLRVCFEHGPPRDPGMHIRLFGARLDFHQAFNGLVCRRTDLDTRNEFADPAMTRYAQNLLDMAASVSDGGLLENVRRTILLLLPSGRCTIELVGDHLGLLPRTLQRRLAEQEQSFSSVMNDVRRQLAARHVLESDRSLTDIADMLGFSASSSFSRWYQSQFGCSAKASRIGAGGCSA